MTQAFRDLLGGQWDPVGHELLWGPEGLEFPHLPLPRMHHNILLGHEILEGQCPLSIP